MKILNKIVIGAALALLVGAMVQPAWAACGGSRIMDNGGAYLVSNPNWNGSGGSRTCAYYGCYATENGPAISDNFSGTFWALGAGDPAFGLGIDNGDWDVANWSKKVAAGTYQYASFLTLSAGELGSEPGPPPTWSFAADGCITDAGTTAGVIDGGECSCMLLTDEWDGVGYFAVLSNFTDVGSGTFDMIPTTTDAGGFTTIKLEPLARPNITGSTRVDEALAIVNFSVDVGALPASAIQQKGGCDCLIGYQVYSYRTGRGGLAPTGRSSFCTAPGQTDCWDLAAGTDGGAQPVTPANGQKAVAQVQVDCDEAAQEDLYLSTMLVLDPGSAGGFSGGNVSQNSFLVECGANLAVPNRQDRGRSDEAPRGRGNDRGRSGR
jgi:hypothetical protein